MNIYIHTVYNYNRHDYIISVWNFSGIHAFFGCCLATQVFIGKFEIGGVGESSKEADDERGREPAK